MDVTLEEILHAEKVLQGVIHHTPIYFSNTFSRMTGSKVYLKFENFQKTGSFKVRGATFKLSTMSEAERRCGVVAASAGNHAQGVAFAASMMKIPCTIVMPQTASPAKISAVKRYGVKIILYGNVFDESLARAKEIARDQNSTLIHAFNDGYVIAGQGTVGLEILQDLPQVDVAIVPVGGGGLISGVALALKNRKPDVKVIGVQSAAYPSMIRSIECGEIVNLPRTSTIADGIAVKRVGTLTFKIAKKYVDSLVMVDDEEVARTIFLLMERTKIVIEPAGAVGLAALLSGKIQEKKKNIVVVLTGGNIDMYLLGQLISRGLHSLNRLIRLAFQVDDKPGALKEVIDIVAHAGGNIVEVQHERLSSRVKLGKAELILSLETQSQEHSDDLIRNLEEKGIKFTFMS